MITLHDLEEQDLEWARELHNDPEVLSMLTDPTEVTSDQQLKWFYNLQNSKTSIRIIAKLEEVPIGIIRIDQIDWHNLSVCVGLDIHKDYRGKGYAKEIYRQIFNYTFDFMKMHRVWLLVADYNWRAIKLYTKLGFKKEGMQREALLKSGNYYDYMMMSIMENEYVQQYIQD